MRQIQRRLEALEEVIAPEDDNSFTFEELCRAIWQRDKRSFRRMVERDCRFGIYVTQFELEDADALRAAKAVSFGRRSSKN